MRFTRRLLKRLVIAVALAFAAFACYTRLFYSYNFLLWSSTTGSSDLLKRPSHPIDRLVARAGARLEQLMLSRTVTRPQAVEAYHKRRGKPPPAGFEAWQAFAEKSQAIVIEEFWDPIYEDLQGLQHLSPASLRSIAEGLAADPANELELFHIRNGTVDKDCSHDDFCQSFLDMLLKVLSISQGVLPDMFIPFNGLISPRVWVTHRQLRYSNTTGSSGDVAGVDNQIEWKHEDNMPAVVNASCPDGSAVRTALNGRDGSATRPFRVRTKGGFVSNPRRTRDPCKQAQLLQIHGSFFAPSFNLVTRQLAPVFSVQRIDTPGNQEIRVPSTIHWEEPRLYHAANVHSDSDWHSKDDVIFWRGANTGGRVNASNWQGFHRHRFVTMTDPHDISLVEESGICHIPWAMPDVMYDFLWRRGDRHALSRFVQKHFDVGFYGYGCWSEQMDPSGSHDTDANTCKAELRRAYHAADAVPLNSMHKHKYLIDLDGNGYSARFRSFMLSSSVPIKATVFSEWFDSRLIPWKHFVPMDNTYGDLWGILDYFLPGCLSDEGPAYSMRVKGRFCGGHDDVAMSIGIEGGKWARKVLRRDDMTLYIFRLLLEYGRLLSGDV